MKTFNLSGTVTISISTKVKAKTLEEAIQIATEREIERGNYGDNHQDEEVWVSDEYDGEPQNIQES